MVIIRMKNIIGMMIKVMNALTMTLNTLIMMTPMMMMRRYTTMTMMTKDE